MSNVTYVKGLVGMFQCKQNTPFAFPTLKIHDENVTYNASKTSQTGSLSISKLTFLQQTQSYLYNVLSVLCCILENRATVLQVFLIKAECAAVDLLQRRIPELGLLQVDQKVGVDWATLDETHAEEEERSSTRSDVSDHQFQ